MMMMLLQQQLHLRQPKQLQEIFSRGAGGRTCKTR